MDLSVEMPGLLCLRFIDTWTPEIIERAKGHKVSRGFAAAAFLTLNAILDGSWIKASS